MILANGNKDTKIIKINCDCGCDEEIQIKKFNDDEIKPEEMEYYMSIHTSKFYSEQKGIFRLIGHRIKLAIKMLFGKEYLLTDVVLKENDINDLVKCLEEIKKN